MGGGGQGSARSDLSGPGRGFGQSGGGDGVEGCGLADITHLVFCLQQQTSSQTESDQRSRLWIQTHLIWAAVVHPVLPVSVEAAGTSEKKRNSGSQDISDSEEADEDRVSEGELKWSQSLVMRLHHAPRFVITPAGRTPAGVITFRCKRINTMTGWPRRHRSVQAVRR